VSGFGDETGLNPNGLSGQEPSPSAPYLRAIHPGGHSAHPSGKLNLQELLLVSLFRIGVEIWRSENEVLRLSELISENTEIN
jgi:hypothetical protein